jgi:hypothetical protein
VNSTETPGGSGIPAGWYDDPSGEGLRWWDGEQWTEHVHTAESAAAASAGTSDGDGLREGKPPRDLVKLRESIRGRGVKAVGMFLGAVVLVIVVVALLVSGGSESKGDGEPGTAVPGAGKVAGAKAKARAQVRRLERQLKAAHLSKAQKKKLQAQLKKLEKTAAAGKNAKGEGSSGNGAGKKSTPDEEGN